MANVRRHDKLNEFFNSDYKWWEVVYDDKLPRGFFSYEMIRRKHILLNMIKKMADDIPSAAVLECGCGPGGILREIDSTGILLAGVDINFTYLAKARADCPSIGPVLQASIESMPFKSNSFDIVFCAGVLGYLEEDRRAIQEMCRVTKPGGKIIIAVQSYLHLNMIFDPYYYLVWGFRTIWEKLSRHMFKGRLSSDKYEIAMMRRYRYKQLEPHYQECGLGNLQTIAVSFGPPTIWRKEVFPRPRAIRISEGLSVLSTRRAFRFLIPLANHWIFSVEKTVEH